MLQQTQGQREHSRFETLSFGVAVESSGEKCLLGSWSQGKSQKTVAAWTVSCPLPVLLEHPYTHWFVCGHNGLSKGSIEGCQESLWPTISKVFSLQPFIAGLP